MRRSRPRTASFALLLAVSPLSVMGGTEVYVPLGSADAIAVVDADADRVVAEIPSSHGLAVSWDGRYLVAGSLLEHPKGALPPKPKDMSEEEHAAHHGSSDEPAGAAAEDTQSTGLDPALYHVTTIRGTGKIYVSSRKSPVIWVLDQQTLALRGEIPIRGEGHEMGVINR